MNALLSGKNKGKGKLVNFETLLVVPKGKDNIFMLSTGDLLPTRLLFIWGNKDVDIIKLLVNLPAL